MPPPHIANQYPLGIGSGSSPFPFEMGNGEALVHGEDLEWRVSMVKNVSRHLKC